jgi:hypothetical protein
MQLTNFHLCKSITGGRFSAHEVLAIEPNCQPSVMACNRAV